MPNFNEPKMCHGWACCARVQISRIHKVLGTPNAALLEKFKRHGAAHVNFDFPEQKGIGISQLIPHATPDCVDLTVRREEALPPSL